MQRKGYYVLLWGLLGLMFGLYLLKGEMIMREGLHSASGNQKDKICTADFMDGFADSDYSSKERWKILINMEPLERQKRFTDEEFHIMLALNSASGDFARTIISVLCGASQKIDAKIWIYLVDIAEAYVLKMEDSQCSCENHSFEKNCKYLIDHENRCSASGTRCNVPGVNQVTRNKYCQAYNFGILMDILTRPENYYKVMEMYSFILSRATPFSLSNLADDLDFMKTFSWHYNVFDVGFVKEKHVEFPEEKRRRMVELVSQIVKRMSQMDITAPFDMEIIYHDLGIEFMPELYEMLVMSYFTPDILAVLINVPESTYMSNIFSIYEWMLEFFKRENFIKLRASSVRRALVAFSFAKVEDFLVVSRIKHRSSTIVSLVAMIIPRIMVPIMAENHQLGIISKENSCFLARFQIALDEIQTLGLDGETYIIFNDISKMDEWVYSEEDGECSYFTLQSYVDMDSDSKFKHMRIGEYQKAFTLPSTAVEVHGPISPPPPAPPSALPSSYSFFTSDEGRYLECMRPPDDQGDTCNTCWAFATSGALSHRYCKKLVDAHQDVPYPRTSDGRLSPQLIVSCVSPPGDKCGINNINNVYFWLVEHPLTLDKCVPYTSGLTGDSQTSKCEEMKRTSSICFGGVNFTPASGGKGEHGMQQEIYHNGPIVATMKIPFSFLNHLGPGVYTPSPGEQIVNSAHAYHSIQISGWGTKDGSDGQKIDYWIMENSWGALYKSFDGVHTGGFALVVRNHPLLEIETNYFTFGTPK